MRLFPFAGCLTAITCSCQVPALVTRQQAPLSEQMGADIKAEVQSVTHRLLWQSAEGAQHSERKLDLGQGLVAKSIWTLTGCLLLLTMAP